MTAADQVGRKDDVDEGEVVVTALRETTTVAKQGVEIRDLPQAVTIIPKQVLDEAAARRFEDISYQTVGLTPELPFVGAQSGGGYSRGFNANQLVDGHVQGYSGFTGGLANLERVEVLRGPTSVLYGQGQPGGSINLVLKRARPQFGLAASATLDTVGTRLADFDVTGPIAGDRLAGRLIVQGEYSDTFRDFDRNRRIAVTPTIRAQPWSGFTLDLIGSYDRYEYRGIRDYIYDPTYVFSIDALKNIPLHRSFGEPTLPLSRLDTWTFRVDAEQKLSDQWSVGLSAYSFSTTFESLYWIAAFDLVPGSATVRTRGVLISSQTDKPTNRSRTASVFVRGDVDLFGMNHKIYASAEALGNKQRFNDFIGDYLPIDTANPIYQPTFVPPTNLSQFNSGGAEVTTKAVYANDLISIGETLNVQLGARYDWIRTTTNYPSSGVTEYRDEKLSPSAGVVWHPIPETSLYASYTTSFVPQGGRTRFLEPLRPERSKAFEVGIKQELFDRRLSATLAAFTITKDDIVQTDLTDPLRNSVINGGTAKSEGFELEVAGRPPIAGMTVRAGVAYAYARISKSTDYTPGDVLVGPRPWTALLSIRQDLDRLGIEGGWFEASGFYGGRQVAAIPDDGYRIPAFTRIDLAAGKRFGPVDVQLNLKNLANQRILLNNGGGILNFDNPRSLGITLRYHTGAIR